MRRSNSRSVGRFLLAFGLCWTVLIASAEDAAKSLTGKTAVTGDWTQDAPGVRHKITVEDLPPPYATESVDNGPRVVRPPSGAQLHVPAGFKIDEYASGFVYPRFLLTAPNGDIFVTESRTNTIKVLRDSDGTGNPT
jgi:glucose/arabinose dehydrogenase